MREGLRRSAEKKSRIQRKTGEPDKMQAFPFLRFGQMLWQREPYGIEEDFCLILTKK